MKRNVDALAPHACSQTINRVIGQLDCLAGRSEGHRREHRAKDFLLRHDRGWMHIAQQCWRKVKSARWQFDLRLPAGCALCDSLINQSLDPI